MAPPASADETGAAQTQNQPQQRPQETTFLANEEDEEYNSEEDPDFDVDNPTATAAGLADEESEGSEPEQEYTAWFGEHAGDAGSRPPKRRKLADDAGEAAGGDANEDFVMGELESGDEATIFEGKERMKKKREKKEKGKKGKQASKHGGGDQEEDDEDAGDDFEIDDDEAGGEGGFVRTRGMKMRTEEERRPLANAAQSTIDVDALWEEMNRPASEKQKNEPEMGGEAAMADKDNTSADVPGVRPGEETVTIKRVYKFAGEVITEEKVVPKDSAEAKLYLASTEKSAAKSKTDQQAGSSPPQTRRPLRRISRFDPNPPDAIKKSWDKQKADRGSAPKGPKLNTVMKSQLDWAAYVDREGIKDELDVHSRAKDSYLNRTDFLNRTEARQEEERRNLRLKNMG